MSLKIWTVYAPTYLLSLPNWLKQKSQPNVLYFLVYYFFMMYKCDKNILKLFRKHEGVVGGWSNNACQALAYLLRWYFSENDFY